MEPLIGNDGWIAEWWGRAFLGAGVEWVGDVRSSVDTPELADFGPAAASRLEHVAWRGEVLRVPPLDLQLAVARRRGLAKRAARIKVRLRCDP